MQYRIGIGYDIHRLTEGRLLFLGGVEIPYARGLLGHSDADVLLHAVTDALLGALGKGDIGDHFPDSDPRYLNISSVELLKQACALSDNEGYRIVNLDTVVIAQEPSLVPFKKSIKRSIAAILGLDESRVSVKAKTQERLGEIGRGEAIAAQAIVLLRKEEKE